MDKKRGVLYRNWWPNKRISRVLDYLPYDMSLVWVEDNSFARENIWNPEANAVVMIWPEYKEWTVYNNDYNSLAVAKLALSILRKQLYRGVRAHKSKTPIPIILCWEFARRFNSQKDSRVIIGDKKQKKRIVYFLKKLWATKNEIQWFDITFFKSYENNADLLEEIEKDYLKDDIYKLLRQAYDTDEGFRSAIIGTRTGNEVQNSNWSENYVLLQIYLMINEFNKWNTIKVWLGRESFYDDLFIRILWWWFESLMPITILINNKNDKPGSIFWWYRYERRFINDAVKIFNYNKSIQWIRMLIWWLILLVLSIPAAWIYQFNSINIDNPWDESNLSSSNKWDGSSYKRVKVIRDQVKQLCKQSGVTGTINDCIGF